MEFSQQQEVRIKPGSNSIETNSIGIAEILSFYKKASSSPLSKVVYDLNGLTLFDGNLSAFLLAIIHRLKSLHRKYVFVEIPSHINVLFRNGLVAHLAGAGNNNKYEDDRKSTIPLKSFDLNEDENFSNYLQVDFFGHRGMDDISHSTKKNLRTQFIEVFNNVQIHSNAQHPMFACGQYFPQQGILKFTMADLNDGFLRKIQINTNGEITTDKGAIEWSLLSNNTTKDFTIYGPGGTGLKDLKKYCETNDGSLQIISGINMSTFVKGRIVNNRLESNYQGAVVNLIFRNLNRN